MHTKDAVLEYVRRYGPIDADGLTLALADRARDQILATVRVLTETGRLKFNAEMKLEFVYLKRGEP